MKLEDAIKQIELLKGYTTIIDSLLSGDMGPVACMPMDINDTTQINMALSSAKEQIKIANKKIADCKSDSAYWGYLVDKEYWEAVSRILQAAVIIGRDNLPDVPAFRRGLVVMDHCAALNNWSNEILTKAKEQSNGDNKHVQ